MKHKYKLTIEFETDKPVKKHADALIQFENGLPYFVDTSDKDDSINYTFEHGTGKARLKKIPK